MEIRINKLRMRNFKGVRDAEYDFAGGNVRIEGTNGSGKSSVFDAFTWLLFGKDHRDQTADTFEIKTIDPATGAPYPRLDHWVEAELSVDGQAHVLRRCWVENWVKPTGQIEEVMKGHNSLFVVDGVDVGTKKAYDAVVSGWMQEAAFKLLTNPHYFIDEQFTPWKARRKALLDLVKDAPERAKVREEFADVVDKLSGRSVEDYRKRIESEKRANKQDLEMTLHRIDGMKEALPEEADAEQVNREIEAVKARCERTVAELRKQAEALDGQIASADKADEARKAQNAAIWGEITKVQLEAEKMVAEARKAAQTQNMEREQALVEARAGKASAEAGLEKFRGVEERRKADIEAAQQARGRIAADLAALGEKYRAEKVRAFEYVPDTRCPYCGQELPAATRADAEEQAREHWNAERKARLDAILDEAKKLKEKGAALEASIKVAQEQLEGIVEERATYEAKVKDWEKKLKEADAMPRAIVEDAEAQVKAGAEYRDLLKKEQLLRSRALGTSSRPDGMDDMVKQRAEIEDRIRKAVEWRAQELEPLNAKLNVDAERARQEGLIEQKQREARNFADALAACERELARIAAYVKADIDSVEASINGLFRVARWKMFDQTMDGAFVEMCDVTSPDGVPYRSMNDAMKILCGLDVIRVFSERFGSRAPIFIDNAEGILRESFDTEAQVVRLVVKDVEKLTLVNE